MLEHFFGSRTRVKLLQIFLRSPDGVYYLRELARLAETQLHAVRREIGNLERLGIIITVASDHAPNRELGQERAKFFQLNPDSMLLPEIKALLLKAEVLEENDLVEDLKNKGGVIRLLVLTGIFTHDSDAESDLVLVGRLKPLVIGRLIKQFENRLGRAIRYTLMSEKEFKERREIGDRFLFGIFEAKHLSVINDFNVS